MQRISFGDWIVWNPAASHTLGSGPDDAPPGGPALTSLIQCRETKLIYSPAHSRSATCLSLLFLLFNLDWRKETLLLGKRSIRPNNFIVWKIRNIFHQVVKHYYLCNMYCSGKKMWLTSNLNIFYTNVWIILYFTAGLRAMIWFHMLIHLYLKQEVRVMAWWSAWLVYLTANSVWDAPHPA